MMCQSIVSSTISESEWGSVLLDENKTVLLSLNASGANVSRQIVRVDHVTSVLSLGSSSNVIAVWAQCLSRSRKLFQKGLNHLFWCDWRLRRSLHCWCFWSCNKGLTKLLLCIAGTFCLRFGGGVRQDRVFSNAI